MRRKFFSPWLTLIGALLLFMVALNGVGTTCQPFSLAESIEQATLAQPWYILPGGNIMVGRLATLLLMAPTLASIFWLARSLFDETIAQRAVWITAILAVPFAHFGWTVADSLLGLSLALVAYGFWRLLRKSQSPPSIVLITGIGLFLFLQTLFRLLSVDNSLNTRTAEFPAATVILWIIGLLGLLALLLGERPANRASYLLVLISVPAVIVLLYGQFTPLIFPSFAIPIALALAYTSSLLSKRTWLAMGIVGGVLLLLPRTDTLQDIDHALHYYYTPETAVVIDVGENYDAFSRASALVSDFCPPRPSNIYYSVDTQQLLHIDALAVPRRVDSSAIADYPGVLLLSSNLDGALAQGKQQVAVIKRPDPFFQFGYYHSPMQGSEILRADAFRLLTFAVRNANSLAPQVTFVAGDVFVVESWWSITQPVTENYMVKVSLVDKGGAPISSSESMIGESLTGQWSGASLHYDRQVLQILPTVEAGNYNVVLSIHGTVFNTANIVIRSPQGGAIGDYGFLTTIYVREGATVKTH